MIGHGWTVVIIAALALSVAWAENENVGGGALDKVTVVEKRLSAGVRETFARGERTFDEGWEFLLGDRRFNFCKVGIGAGGNDNGVAGLLREETDWTAVDLPHDWMLSMSVERAGRNGFRAVGKSFPNNSVAWYRKRFSTAENPVERPTVFLQFDGIYRDAMVWFNGVYLGRNDSGYIGCRFDVSDLVEYGGAENSVAVRVDASGTEGWWYEGAGIYRHVRLIVKGRDHLRPDSLLFRTRAVTNGVATVCASAEVVGAGKVEFDLDGEKFTDKLTLAKPRLWSPEQPELYTLTARLVGADGTVRDSVTRKVGIRTLVFDAARGLLVNGTPTKVKGVCCHADMGCVGVAIPDALHDYRVRLLKEMGANAVRTSHNPPAPEFLDACDRGGILVMDETRCFSSTDEGLSQLRRLVLRDRNHPCVVTWSIGNEEHNVQARAVGARIARRMRDLAKSLAPDIAVTYGGNNGTCGTGANAEVDVRGVNYIRIGSRKDLPRGTFDAPDRYHAAHPEQAIWGTEEASALSTRGSRKDWGPKDVQLMKDGDSFEDNVRFPWVATAEQWWNYAVTRPWFAGSFAWTGFDYRGETRWPATVNNFGIMDLCGFPKASYWYYQANWTERDVLHAWPDWTPGVTNLWVDSNCDEIELLVNGRSIAKRKGDRLHHLAFPVKYESGEAVLRGTRGGRTVTYRMVTPSPAVRLTLTTDRPAYLSSGDAMVVNVQAQDEKGNEAFDACDEVKFSCSGVGKIIGVGNGDPLSHEDDVCTNGWHRKLFNGKCQFVVRTDKAHGEIRLRAEFATGKGVVEKTVKVSGEN